MDEVREFLQQCRLGHRLEVLLPHLEDLGVGCLQDLLDVEKENLEGIGLSVIERNRFFRSINEQLRTPISSSSSSAVMGWSPQSSEDSASVSSIPMSLVTQRLPTSPVPHMGSTTSQGENRVVQSKATPSASVCGQPERPAKGSTGGSLPSSSVKVQDVEMTAEEPNPSAAAVTLYIQIRYILCSGLFATETREKIVFNLDPQTTAMKDLYGMIRHAVHVEEHFTLELFSHEGYPLNFNDYTCHCTLAQWKVMPNSLFYVFIRREDQPEPPAPQSQPMLDHTIGKDELTIESSLFGTFTIRADVDNDSADDICRKVAHFTKVQSSFICLFTRRGYERLNVDTELRDGDILTLVLKDPHHYLGSLGTEYGAKTYNPLVSQTEMGLSKFFSILKFICSKQRENVDILRLLSYLRRVTHCPPMIHALKLLYENSYLSLPCWVALVEGCYQLFSSFLSEFCIVEDKRVFEYSDYFWALFISKSELTPPTDSYEYVKLSLMCPISQLKITQPVSIPGCTEVFDQRSVIERVEAGVTIAGCSKFPLTDEDMNSDWFVSRMLLYHPWESEKEIYVLKDIVLMAKTGITIPRVFMPCSWEELPTHLPSLRIAAPDGLFSGNECLTFVTSGQMVYFMGFGKDRDAGRKVYNPVKCDYQYHTKAEMAKIAKTKEAIANVTCDLTTVLKPEIKSRTSRSVLERARPEPVVAEKEVTKVDWEPEEAIVVLLDCSGSMSLNVFDGEDDGMTRLDAAKDFFEAFANRSQAYDFHHSMGLTVFNNKVKTMQLLTKIYEFFRESLEKVEANYQTALNDAMMNAVKQLKDYTKNFPNCRRRILCLTDGVDNCSKKSPSDVARTLQEENVVVDTILIVDSPENVTQKSITHASGGACYLPTTRSEALKLFEMETLLSIRARVMPANLPTVRRARDLKAYENMSAYPYNCGQLPSNFIKEVQDTKTASAEKVLNTASLAMTLGDSEASASSVCSRRVLREINEFRRNPHTDIEIFPSEEDIRVWKIILKGPEFTPYADGIFLLCAKFPTTYPAKPPEVRFLTPIYHCNINSTGRICHRVFGPSYTPSVTVRDILSCVCGLLMSPEPDDPLDSVLADEFHSNRHVYMEKARKSTQEHAKGKTFAQLKKELSGRDSHSDTPSSNLTCPLTGKLFEDPVIAPSGHTYERAAILEHLKKHGGKEPLTAQPLKVEQLTPNRAMKGLVEQYKKGARKVAF